MLAFLLAALGLVLLIELKIRTGPFAKELLPIIVTLLWTLVLTPLVVAIPLVTLVPAS